MIYSRIRAQTADVLPLGHALLFMELPRLLYRFNVFFSIHMAVLSVYDDSSASHEVYSYYEQSK